MTRRRVLRAPLPSAARRRRWVLHERSMGVYGALLTRALSSRTHPAPFTERATPHPALIPQEVAGSSRPMPGNPRNATVGKPCSRRESPPIPAQPASTKTGLSRRRSRVRVPSLPLKVPANRHLLSSLDRRPFMHPAQIPHANRPGNPRTEPVVAANPRKKDDRPIRPEVDRSQIQKRPFAGSSSPRTTDPAGIPHRSRTCSRSNSRWTALGQAKLVALGGGRLGGDAVFLRASPAAA